jgi:hypothetical protein
VVADDDSTIFYHTMPEKSTLKDEESIWEIRDPTGTQRSTEGVLSVGRARDINARGVA